MVTGALVDEQIEDGEKVVAHLVEDGFDLAAVCWIQLIDSEDNEWSFYTISEVVDKEGSMAAIRRVNQAIRRLPFSGGPWLTNCRHRFVGLNDKIAKEVLDFRARYPGRKWMPGAKLGSHTILQAYIYPMPVKSCETASASA